LEFRNVTFEFEPGKPVLRDVSFVVEPGGCVAILGPTGAGKTALLSLISRFYDPTAGQILVDDVDIRLYDLYDLRRAMGLVFQETFLFSNSIRANIAFGYPDATAEQVIAAAKIANAHEFVSAMKEGYESVLAEGGSNLSGGQRQRLAIARAILLQPSFLLLDDPMAAVDAQTEHEMSEALTAAMAGRTTLLVANRISSLRRAELILVMQKGRIAQRGTHEQLMAIPGHYRETARLQIDEEARKTMATAGGSD
jgi:ATP-binding cassette subfamily B protein